MTNSPGQPDKQSAIPLNDAEATMADDVPMPVQADSDGEAFESTSVDTGNVDETMLGEFASQPGDSVSNSGVPSAGHPHTDSDQCDFPSEFGRYAIKKQLGRGAMGAVFLAQDTQLNRDIALKVPTFGDKSPANMIERFYREARSAATLTHPNICPVYDVGEHNGIHFISMGYIEGRPLSAYIESGKKQPERQAAAVIRKLALALQEAHDKGIIHRDLKPANIMIDHRSEPVVMDFGLARLTNDVEEARLTREGTVMGSPAYMSPEQVEGRKLGPQCDVYSLGVVFYELLTGQTPYQGSVVSVIGQILAAKPKPPTELRPDISAECSAVCLKAMASKPSERFQSMAEYAEALNAFIKGDSQAIDTFVELDSGASLSLDELKKQKASATSFLKKKQFKNAVSALETLSELKDKQAADVAAWAKQQLPRAQEHYEKATEESKALFRRAKKNMAAHDYERASQQLSQIPVDLRNNTVSDLKAEADDLAEEVKRLSDDVAHAVQTGVHDDMLPTVERLLELKPQHRQANDLYEQLYNAGREARPSLSQKQRKKSPAGSQPDLRLIGGAAAAVVVLIVAVMFWPGDSDGSGNSVASSPAATQPDAGNVAVVPPEAIAASTPTGPKRVQDADSEGNDGRKQILEFLRKDRRATPEDFMMAFDTNSDRQLDRTEVNSKLIARSDENGDAELSLEEVRLTFDDIFGGPPGRRNDQSPNDRLFSEFLDSPSKDGRSIRGPAGGRPDDIFDRHDENRDGVLAGLEIPPFFTDRIDRNSDGEITLTELRQTMQDIGPEEAFRKPPTDNGFRPRDGRPRGLKPRD